MLFGTAGPIGTTASHPFWSKDRQQFVPAGDLRVGENLLLADDTTRRVESLTGREKRETVYNIEVDGEHVFFVGNDGVLVHNSCTHHMHHSIPRGIQRRLPAAIRNHRDIIGRPGLANRMRVAIGRHREIHNGSGYRRSGGIGGGHYNNRFHQEIMSRGGYGKVKVKDILAIRDLLVKEFGL